MTPSWATAMADMAWKRAFEESNVSALLRVPSSFSVAAPPPMPAAVVLAPSSTVVVVVGPVDIRPPPPTMLARVPPPPTPDPVPEFELEPEAPRAMPPAQMQAPPFEPLELPVPDAPDDEALPFPFPLPFPPAGVVGVVPPLGRVGLTVVE